MLSSELVTPQHLARQALIYIRQSTPHQVLTNQESLNLQYALKEKARLLGWREVDIVVIDADLGLTGAAASHREGFKELSTRVTLGQVGIILFERGDAPLAQLFRLVPALRHLRLPRLSDRRP